MIYINSKVKHIYSKFTTYENFMSFRMLSVFEIQLYNLNTLLIDCFTLFIFHNFITRWK